MLIAIGRLGKPHGIRGEMKLRPFFGLDLAESLAGGKLFAEPLPGGEPLGLVLVSARGAGQNQVVAFAGIGSPDEAGVLANRTLLLPREAMPDLPDGQFYHEEIVGLPVFDPDGKPLGRLTGFFSAGAADVWVITGDSGEEIMTPCLPETLLGVDLKKGRIVMKPMETE